MGYVFCNTQLKLYLKSLCISIMDDEQDTKQPPQRIPFTHPVDQADSDSGLAMALQEQETTFSAMLETIESQSDEENESNNDDDQSNIDNDMHFDYQFFQSMYGYEVPELEFIEDDEDSSDDDDMDEDIGELDVDELTYEELIALGDFIGVEKRGLSLNEISTCLNPFVCRSSSSSGPDKRSSSSGAIDRCVICQNEYEDGEALVAVLPCEHPYHSDCISKWLQIKRCCPICSTEVNSSSPKKP